MVASIMGVLLVWLFGQLLKDALPHPLLAPAVEAHVHTVPVAEALGQVTPGDARPEAVQHRFHKQAVVFGGDADMAAVAGQTQLLQPFPLLVAQSIASFHDPHSTAVNRN
jgi:hypothetical protein